VGNEDKDDPSRRLRDCQWDLNRVGGPKPCKLYDDENCGDDDDDDSHTIKRLFP
jgi:hypothetical protein